jgi:hypothetical protein
VTAFDVFGLQTLFARNNVEVDIVAFVQGPEPFSLDRAVMDEDVLTGFLGDEAKPVFVIKPLYFATGHNALSPEIDARGGRNKKKDTTGTYVVFFYIWSRIRLNYRLTIKSGNTPVKEKLFTKPAKTRRLFNFYFN